jgi:Kef-type K+ transport system membrane component KefB
MPLVTSILLLIVGARLLGQLMLRFKQPAVVGEILAGVVLGPSFLKLVAPTENLAGISELSCFLIVLSAGLEMEFGDVIKAVRGRGGFAAAMDFFIPLGSGILLGRLFNMDAMRTIFLGLCISITALPVAIRILDNFKLLNSRIAKYAIATSILNDVAALLCLGIILDMPLNMPGATHLTTICISVLKTSGKLLIFCLLVFVASRLFRWGGSQTQYIQKLVEKIIGFFGPEALFGVAVLFVLLFGSIGEQLGTHYVIGAFFGALLLSKDLFGTSLFSDLEHTLNSITSGFLAPIFFAYIGLRFSVQTFSSPSFVLAVLAVSVFSKLIAGYAGSRWIKMSKIESLGVGIILNGRGIMELVVANIAYQRGFINQELFSILVLMGLFTTVLTPILFRRFVIPGLEKVTQT